MNLDSNSKKVRFGLGYLFQAGDGSKFLRKGIIAHQQRQTQDNILLQVILHQVIERSISF